jgi:hypothetical protein
MRQETSVAMARSRVFISAVIGYVMHGPIRGQDKLRRYCGVARRILFFLQGYRTRNSSQCKVVIPRPFSL